MATKKSAAKKKSPAKKKSTPKKRTLIKKKVAKKAAPKKAAAPNMLMNEAVVAAVESSFDVKCPTHGVIGKNLSESEAENLAKAHKKATGHNAKVIGRQGG